MAEKKTRKRAYIPPSSEVVNRKERTTSSPRASRSSAGSGRSKANASNARGGANYVYPVPSYKRTARRLPVYFLLIFAMQFFLLGSSKHHVSSQERLLTALLTSVAVTVLFAPFMHIMDKMAYNRWLKRSDK